MRIIRLLAVLFCPLLIMGCASITTGSHQMIPINSTPAGADVVSNTGFRGVTPCTANLKRNQDHTLTISKEAYDTAVVVLRKGLCGSTAGNLILGGVIGLGVDACTGAMFKLEPTEVNVILNKKDNHERKADNI